MGKNLITNSSLRNHLLEHIESFLKVEGFALMDIIRDGILVLVNSVADYYEEGKRLYPEVVITNNMEIFKTLPSRILKIQSSPLQLSSFKQAVKLCAPLSVDGWVIFIEINEENINFGVVSTEMTETSLSLSKQTESPDAFPDDSTLVLIRCVGEKVVELTGLKSYMHVSLSLDEDRKLSNEYLEILADVISCDYEGDERDQISIFIEKLIDSTLKVGHGNLIGVVEDIPEKIAHVKASLDDGVYLEMPIDLASLVSQTINDKKNGSSMPLRSYSSLVSSMLNHDGITLFSTKGRLLGYHLFVKDNKADNEVVGGARSRAFEAMKSLGLRACFYKSQDGNVKICINE